MLFHSFTNTGKVVRKMVDRNKYDFVINSLCLISSHYKECGFEKSIQEIRSVKETFDIKLMFVGHFNAGKSSLLNGLIERPGFLKEGQLPQTAVATELRYDEKEHSFAYRRDGGREPLTDRATRAPSEYSHLEYQLPAPGLKQVSDYTIVDTPGFDSGIEVHTKALANYIGVGSAYIVVADQEKGGIDETTLRFIEEISQYSDQIAVLLNKCDKITKTVAEEIAASARALLMSRGFLYPVYTISKWDKDVCGKLVSVISTFNAQQAFNRAMERQIRTELVSLDSILSITRQKLYLDTFDLDEEIRTYTRAGEQASEIFEQKRRESTRDLDSVTEQVITQIRSALMARADIIMEALLSGNQTAAEANIVETVRPIMLSTMKDISIRQIDSITSALDFTGLMDVKEREALSDVVRSLAVNMKDLIAQGTFETKLSNETEKKERKKSAYRAVAAGAAIVTDIVAPWMEIIIILLPDIVSLLQGIFGESSSDQLKRRFINNVVPQICNKLYPQIRQNIETSSQQVLCEYQVRLEEKLVQMKASIAAAEAQKKERKDTFEAYKGYLEEDIALVQKLLQETEMR